MDKAQDVFQKVNVGSMNLKIGNSLFAPTYLQAMFIIFLLFLLVFTLARLRRTYVNWSLKGASTMLFLGFMLALVIEGFLIIGGRTALTEVLGWKNAPKPIQTALDSGRDRLVDVLGVTEEVPSMSADEGPTLQSVIDDFQSLTPDETQKLKKVICTP